jgi:hypothetical protein
MSDTKKTNVPVYFFLGFRLLEATYKHRNDDTLTSFGIKIVESLLDKKNRDHALTIQFNMTIGKNEESTFIFNSGYQINDFEWYNSLAKEQIDALFLSVLFPYVREKVYSLTNDYRGNIDIPIIDLRHADLTEGAIFEKENIQK